MNGNAIIITATSGGNQIIAAAKSGEIQTECGTIEIASSAQRDWEWNNFIKGRKSWSVTVNFLMVAASSGNTAVNIRSLLNVGTTYTLIIKSSASGDQVTGSAILKSMDVQGAVGNLATGSWKFEGNGKLE